MLSKSFLAVPALAAMMAVQMFVAAPVRAGSIASGTGLTNKPPTDCARDGMRALSETGFSENLNIFGDLAPNMYASGNRAGADGAQATIICTQRGDIVVVATSHTGPEAGALRTMVADKLNQIMGLRR
jgi:hypothetical protein